MNTPSVQELKAIIRTPDGLTMEPSRDMDEVYDNLFIGDYQAALNKTKLQKLNIKYVLNVAAGELSTNERYYDGLGINYLGLNIEDEDDFRIQNFFDESSHFINKALRYNDKILVHCRAGISRSATIVIAYLMLHKGLTVQEAIRQVRKHREVCPNNGFLQCLCNLDKTTRR